DRLVRAADESVAFVVELQAQQNIGVFEFAEPRPLQLSLMRRDGFADLSLLAIQVAENHVDFERVRVEAGRAAQLFDRQVDLVRHQEIEAENVVRRLPCAAPIDPLAIPQLVTFPGLADGQADQQGDEHRKQRTISAHVGSSTCSASRLSQRSCARSTSSTRARAAPSPPFAALTQWTRVRTSSTASAGAVARPTRASTGRSSTSSPMYATCSSSISSESTICS